MTDVERETMLVISFSPIRSRMKSLRRLWGATKIERENIPHAHIFDRTLFSHTSEELQIYAVFRSKGESNYSG
jgi:hypothetical protein